MLGLDRETADRNIENLLRRFQAAHPEKPVFCVGVFPCRNDIETGFAGRAREFRDLVRQVVADIDAPNMVYIDGSKAMDPARGLTTDLTHPSPAGMIDIAEYVSREIAFDA